MTQTPTKSFAVECLATIFIPYAMRMGIANVRIVRDIKDK